MRDTIYFIDESFSVIIFDFCFLAIITLNLSKSLKFALFFLFSSFFAQAVLFHFSKVFCSVHAFFKFFTVEFLGSFSTTMSVKERHFKEMTCL